MVAPQDLSRHGRAVESVFDLLGRDENDLTAAVGFALARSPLFLSELMHRVLGGERRASGRVRMEVRDDLGRTDLEVEVGPDLVVIEAKRGWSVPSAEQLRRYVGRVRGHGGGCLVTMSESTTRWAGRVLPADIDGVPVLHVPWSDVQAAQRRCLKSARGAERVWLVELDRYLRGSIPVTEPSDMWTYCVVLNDHRPGDGGALTFKEYVRDAGVYFHPYGAGGWPKSPPNFFAFRWAGKVQRVHRVQHHKVVERLQARWPDIPVTPLTDRPHVVHQLGPALRFEPLPNGKRYRAGRNWVLLDQLLTCGTLAEALAETDRLRGR